jgi:hypothetical protein
LERLAAAAQQRRMLVELRIQGTGHTGKLDTSA